ERLVPPQTTMNVVTNDATVFFSETGVKLTATEFFARLGTAHEVAAAGAFDAGTNTLTAAYVKLPSEGAPPTAPHLAAVSGVTSNVNATAGTFTLGSLAGWEGFVPSGATLNVVTTGDTTFLNASQQPVAAADFFGSLADGAKVRVIGTLSGG